MWNRVQTEGGALVVVLVKSNVKHQEPQIRGNRGGTYIKSSNNDEKIGKIKQPQNFVKIFQPFSEANRQDESGVSSKQANTGT